MRPRPLARSLLVSLALTACASGGARRGGTEFAVLEVRNDYLGPLDLYAVRDGFPQRVGSVTSSGVQRFRLNSSLIGASGTIRIIAVPLAENGRASTGTITVHRGDVIQFNISPTLTASSVFIR